MSLNWQDLAAAALVVIAIAYLARAGWRTLCSRGSSACGGRCACPDQKSTPNGPVIGVEELVRSARGADAATRRRGDAGKRGD